MQIPKKQTLTVQQNANFYTGEYYRSEIMSYWFYRLSEDD